MDKDHIADLVGLGSTEKGVQKAQTLAQKVMQLVFRFVRVGAFRSF